MVIEWSKYQKDIFEEITKTTGNVVVQARAGSAKTTTLVESLKHIPEDKSWIVIAFNRRIAAELKKRVPKRGKVSTLHSLGLSCIKNSNPNVIMNEDKLNDILDRVFGSLNSNIPNIWKIRDAAIKTINLAKSCLAKTTSEIDEILVEYEIYDHIPEEAIETFIPKIIACIDISVADHKQVDYADMIYFPNVLKLKKPKYDYVFIDEAQDLSKAQMGLALQVVKSTGRIFAFLDENQSIYKFMACDFKSVMDLIKKLNPKTMPLPISYRCPIKVVERAQKFVPDILPAPNAKIGEDIDIFTDEIFKLAKPGCFIISRKNADMVQLCLEFIIKGIPCNILGKDIGLNLLNIIKKSEAQTIDQLLLFIDIWEQKEITKLLKKHRKPDIINDKAKCIRYLCDKASSISKLKENINELFSDEDSNKKVIFGTVHAVKGLERDNVFILWDTFFGGDQDLNLRYVAITRSKNRLYNVYPRTN